MWFNLFLSLCAFTVVSSTSKHTVVHKHGKSVLFNLENQKFTKPHGLDEDISSATMIVHGDLYFFYGGARRDVLVYDTRSRTSKRVGSNTGAVPDARKGHIAVAHRGVMYIFGGETVSGLSNDFWSFNLNTHVWSELNANEVSARVGSAAAVDSDVIWLFGGRTKRGSSSEVFTYDIKLGSWIEVDVVGSELPSPRSGAAAIFIGKEFVLFGGQGGDGTYYNDVWSLHAGDVESAKFVKAAIIDAHQAPDPRKDAHLLVHDEAIWVFGGHNSERVMQDVWALDLEYLQWELISCYPGLAFPHCREAGLIMHPPVEQKLSKFAFANPGFSESSYTLKLSSAPSHPVHITPRASSGHVQLSPAEVVFDENNWHVPQRVRVIVLEDLWLPGDSSRVSVTHSVRTTDHHYANTAMPKRIIEIPTLCGDGRCTGEETAHSCALDCRNAKEHTHMCGDGLCHHDETHETCATDCGVQGTDNSCPAEKPVRCRTGHCVVAAGVCAMRKRSTASSCDYSDNCVAAQLQCAEGHNLCPDGTCVESGYECKVLPPCPVGTTRCFDTTCRKRCGGDDERCPPGARNLIDSTCLADPEMDSIRPFERILHNRTVRSTMLRPRQFASRIPLIGGEMEMFGQVTFAPGSLRKDTHADCPCSLHAEMEQIDPLVSVEVSPLDHKMLPDGAIGGFCIAMKHHPAALSERASVWMATESATDNMCLGRHANDGWHCVDEHLERVEVEGGFHTRGRFSIPSGCYALIVDNCVGVDNPDQANSDNDAHGDACDAQPNVPEGKELSANCEDFEKEADHSYIENIKARLAHGADDESEADN